MLTDDLINLPLNNLDRTGDRTMSRHITAYIALGSNLGDRAANIKKTLGMLSDLDGVSTVTPGSITETKPLGPKDQPDYLNTAAKITTTLTPEILYEKTAAIEDALGRKRIEKWAQRTIDLDILLYGDQIIQTPDLTIPHSQMHLRSFVLQPLCEFDPDIIHPVIKQPVRELAARLAGNDFIIDSTAAQLISVAGIIGVGKTTLAEALARALNCPLIPEAYDTNPYLADVYAGKKHLALDCQTYFLNSRIEQLNPQKLQPAHPFVTDYIFAKEMIYAQQSLASEQFIVYKQRNSAVADSIARPVLVIYMKDSPQACLDRIHSRNRPYEQRIEIDTLTQLYNEYEKLFSDWPLSPLISIDVGSFNCLDTASIASLANEVNSYICKSQKQ